MKHELTPIPEERLEPIAEVTQSIATAQSAQEVYSALFLFATRTTPATSIFVALYTPGTASRRCVYAADLTTNDEGNQMLEEDRNLSRFPEAPLSTDPQSEAILTGSVINTPDLDEATSGLPRTDVGSDDGEDPPHSSLVVPFGGEGSVLGAAEFQSPAPEAFDNAHIAPLKMAANLAAIATHNLQLRDEEKRARKAAEADRQHLLDLLDHAPNLMAAVEGPDHVFTNANSRYVEAFGLTDVTGKPVRDVHVEAEAHGIITHLNHVYRTGNPFTADAMPMDITVHGRSKRFYFNLTFQPLRDLEGNTIGILGHINDVTKQVQASERLAQANADLQAAYDDTIEGWARALDLKDAATAGHSYRVTRLAVGLARAMNVSEKDIQYIRWGALLHDIGKVGVPDAILRKPGKLTGDEWEAMKSHTTYAAELLEPIAHLRPALDIPLQHHERWDGTGYPEGLTGTDIPLAARIFAVVDVYDTLTSDRPYRRAWSTEDALELIRAESGTHFDPTIVNVFLDEVKQRPPYIRG